MLVLNHELEVCRVGVALDVDRREEVVKSLLRPDFVRDRLPNRSVWQGNPRMPDPGSSHALDRPVYDVNVRVMQRNFASQFITTPQTRLVWDVGVRIDERRRVRRIIDARSVLPLFGGLGDQVIEVHGMNGSLILARRFWAPSGPESAIMASVGRREVGGLVAAPETPSKGVDRWPNI